MQPTEEPQAVEAPLACATCNGALIHTEDVLPCAFCGKPFCRKCGKSHFCEANPRCASAVREGGVGLDERGETGDGSELGRHCRPWALRNLGPNFGQPPPPPGPATTLEVPGRSHGAPRRPILGPKAGFRPPSVAVAFDVGGLPPFIPAGRWVRTQWDVTEHGLRQREAAASELRQDPPHPENQEPDCEPQASLGPCAPQAPAAPCEAEPGSASSSGYADRKRSRSPSPSIASTSRLDLVRELRNLEDALDRRRYRLDFDSENLASAKTAVRRLEDRVRKSAEDVASTKEHIANCRARFPYFE